jgi:hypothetical protein
MKSPFTPEEEKQIFLAAGKTWGYVASDAAQLGPVTIGVAIELVLDAGRIQDIGKLNPAIYEKLVALEWKKLSAFMKKNRGQWY